MLSDILEILFASVLLFDTAIECFKSLVSVGIVSLSSPIIIFDAVNLSLIVMEFDCTSEVDSSLEAATVGFFFVDRSVSCWHFGNNRFRQRTRFTMRILPFWPFWNFVRHI